MKGQKKDMTDLTSCAVHVYVGHLKTGVPWWTDTIEVYNLRGSISIISVLPGFVGLMYLVAESYVHPSCVAATERIHKKLTD